MDPSSAPRVYPWTMLGLGVGLVAAALVALAAWGRSDEIDVTIASVVAVSGTTILFAVVIGLAVGQFIRVSGVVNAWRPALPTVLDAPRPSPNGHGSAEGEPAGPVANGAVFAVLSAIGAVLAGPVVVPLLPAPLVLGIGALALDERTWVRVTASGGVFIAAMSLAGFFVNGVLDSGLAGPVFLVLIVAIGGMELLVVRRVRPRR